MLVRHQCDNYRKELEIVRYVTHDVEMAFELALDFLHVTLISELKKNAECERELHE
jgi:hypothetical protein